MSYDNHDDGGLQWHAQVGQQQEQEMQITHTPAVYAAIAGVAQEIAGEGISKSRKNQQQGYSFRGIDDVYNALAPILSKNNLVILPRVLSRECVERQTAKGGNLFYTIVEVEFDFVCSKDGSKHTVKTFGEAMDSADKSTNKAMSAAYKYAAMQAFCIPTEGDNDADATTHAVAPRQAKPEPLDVKKAVDAMRQATTIERLNKLYMAALAKAADEQKSELETAYHVCKDVIEESTPTTT